MSESKEQIKDSSIVYYPKCDCKKDCYANGGYIWSYGELGPWHEEECDLFVPF